jgi:putative transposase
VLRQAEEGTAVGEVCRKAGISEATFYNWRKRYGGMMPSEVRRLRQIEEENGKLKKLVADLSLDKAMLQDVLTKKLVRQCLLDHWRSIGSPCAAARTRRHDLGNVEGQHPADLRGAPGKAVELPLQGPAPSAGRADEADQRDCRDAGTVWLPARPRPAEKGRLGGERQARLPDLQGVGLATQEQDAEAAGEGEAPGGPVAADPRQ